MLNLMLSLGLMFVLVIINGFCEMVETLLTVDSIW